MGDELPVFDDEWVAQARHTELSASELERRARRSRRQHRRRRLRRLFGTAVAFVLFAAVGWYLASSSTADRNQQVRASGDVVASIWSARVAGDRPTPTRPKSERLLDAVTPTERSSSYTFTNSNADGSPIRYDPCRTISVVVNPLGAPSDARAIVERAVARVSAASGLAIEIVGDTDEAPTIDRPLYDPDRYGDRWAPVLIAWTDASVIPDLEGDTAGIGGSGWIAYDAELSWYVSGLVYLDRDLGPDPDVNELVLLHELGHVVGLDHVDDRAEIMNAAAVAADFGPGDLTGLAQLGAGPCAALL